jgi:hypothetical protein
VFKPSRVRVIDRCGHATRHGTILFLDVGQILGNRIRLQSAFERLVQKGRELALPDPPAHLGYEIAI